MKIEEWQEKVDKWIKEYGVRYFDVLTNTLLLSEEVGEFSRLIARQYGEQSFKQGLTEAEVQNQIKEEIGDIIFVVTCLANQMDISLDEVLDQNIRKKTDRDFERHLQNQKLKG